MRIVLSSLWAPVGVAAYLLRAARRLGLEVVTVGPTMGADCWGFKEFHFPEHAIYPQWPDAVITVQSFGSAHNRFEKPDLWIDVDGGHFTDHPMPWPHAVVATDPHMDLAEHGEHWAYKRQREVADFFFCMQRPYIQANHTCGIHKQDHFLPYAYDPAVFHPYPDQKMDADVTVLGLPYTKRRAVAAELQRRGFRVLAGMGTIYEKYARDLCRAPVCFIWSLKDDVPCRVFEAAACGRLIVANDSIHQAIVHIEPRLESQIAYFEEAKGVPGAVAAVEYWFRITQGTNPPIIKGPVASWQVRGEDARVAIQPHTWDARLRQIVKTCLGKEI